jgi:deferrochelatase/peroxidase EfeB
MAGSLLVAAGAWRGTGPATASTRSVGHGRQGGIVTPPQRHLRFVAFDVTVRHRLALRDLLDDWHEVATSGAGRAGGLTVTYGVGPGLFAASRSALGLGHRPTRLTDLPAFTGDSLEPRRCHGDVGLQICGDDAAQVRAVAGRLTRRAAGRARLRWLQDGARGPGRFPRNRFGFHDGNGNLDVTDPTVLRRHVWVDSGPDWLRGGTYLVVRRFRMDVEQWHAESSAEQEQVIGRHRLSGAPLSGGDATTPLDLTATDAAGALLEPVHSHVVVAHPSHNDGVQLLRRGYSFDDGVDQWGRLDTGLFFCAFTNDPPGCFVPMQRRLARLDALGRYVTGTGSAVFAIPRGTPAGQTWGDQLLG